VYDRHAKHLSYTSKREIATYVHNLVPKTNISIWFPELPEPMKIKERDVAAIPSVEQAERDAKLAKEALREAKGEKIEFK
jgi:hypothetical protein